MKKVLVVCVLGFFTVLTTKAQEVKLGAKAGINLSTFTGDSSDDIEGLTSFHIGFVAEIPITEKFAVQPELIYSKQGAQQNFSLFEFKSESKIRLDYLNIPIMAKYYIIEGFSIEAGPQIGINVKAENENEQNDGITTTQEVFDISDQTSSIDLGFGGGLAYQLPLGVFFQARYMLGLSNINDKDNVGFFGNNFKNANLSLSVGYKF